MMAKKEGSSAMELEKSELQNLIMSMLHPNRTKLRKPFTVAIVGAVGVGKSSLINSIATAMSQQRWREHATTGFHGGEAEPVTRMCVRMYPQCCREDEHANVLIPTLLDIGGLPNEVDQTWTEVLGLIFSGRVPDKENLLDVHDYLQNLPDPEGNSYPEWNSYWRVNKQMVVDRIVVVGSATSQVPENLLKAVVTAARPKRGINSRDIPVFGVITKYDLIDSEGKEEFQKRERKFKSILGLEGAETRYLCCRNYCGANDPDNRRVKASIPELDVPILKLMLQISDPQIQVVTQKPPSFTEQLSEMKEQWMPIFWKAVRQFQSYDPEIQKIIAIVCLFILVVVFVVFMIVVERLMRLL